GLIPDPSSVRRNLSLSLVIREIATEKPEWLPLALKWEHPYSERPDGTRGSPVEKVFPVRRPTGWDRTQEEHARVVAFQQQFLVGRAVDWFHIEAELFATLGGVGDSASVLGPDWRGIVLRGVEREPGGDAAFVDEPDVAAASVMPMYRDARAIGRDR